MEKLTDALAELDKTAALAAVEEAIAAVGDRPMILNMSRTMTKAQAKDVIRKDFEMIRKHPGFIFNYSIKDMTRNDKAELMELHRWMNGYWREHIGGRGEKSEGQEDPA